MRVVTKGAAHWLRPFGHNARPRSNCEPAPTEYDALDTKREETNMAQETNTKDPLEFVRGMWSNMGFSLPGMVTPTLDVDELDRRIKDMKAVEGWLKMNLNMLQMSIQGLEMQRAALAAVRAMSEQARGHQAEEKSEEAPATPSNPFAAAAALWPWNMMGSQQPAAAPPVEEEAPEPPKASRGRHGAATAKKS